MIPFNNFTDSEKYLFSNDIFSITEKQYRPYQNGSWSVLTKNGSSEIITTADCWAVGKIIMEKILLHVKGENIFFVTSAFEAGVKKISHPYPNRGEYQKKLFGYPTYLKQVLSTSAERYESIVYAGPLVPIKDKYQNKFHVIVVGHLFLVYAYSFMTKQKIEELFTRELLMISDMLTWNPLPFYN